MQSETTSVAATKKKFSRRSCLGHSSKIPTSTKTMLRNKSAPSLLTIALLATQFAPTALSQANTAARKRPLSANALIAELKSANWHRSGKAARQIYARGASMIPALMTLRGDTQPMAAPWALFPFTSSSPRPFIGEITIEVTALFLIDAVSQQRFTRSGDPSPWLRDAIPPYYLGGGPAHNNTPERVARAWDSTEAWYKEFRVKGINRMRRERPPLAQAHLYFF